MKLEQINYKNSSEHIPALDGIRGFAALSVVMAHIIYLLTFGWVGVDLFFVLSGFLITSILIDSKAYFHNFYLKRVIRIFPLYYLAILVVYLITKHGNFDNLDDFNFSTIFFLSNIDWSIIGTSTKIDLLGHFWFLAIEEQFYVVFPFVIRYTSIKILKRIILVFVSIALLLRCTLVFLNFEYPIPYAFTFCRMDGLLIGAYIACYVRENNTFNPKLFYMFLLFFVALIYFGRHPDSLLMMTVGYTVMDIFFGLLILNILTRKGFFYKIFSNKLLVTAGKYSFGIYVYHPIFIFLCHAYLVIDPLTTPSYLSILARFLPVLLTFIIAYISFHLYESRFYYLRKFTIK